MNALAEKWVKALESGKFKQTKTTLVMKDKKGELRYCCLGVACVIAGRKVREYILSEDGYKILGFNDKESSDGFETKLLPESVRKLLRLHTTNGMGFDSNGYELEQALAKLNDDGKTFKQIAKYIRKHEKELFYS